MSNERIYLTGFMGSGKSTIGPRVARILGYDSIDLDREIVDSLGMSIPAIFDVLGEESFRTAESEMLRATADRSGVVVSLGGGTIAHSGNLDFCLGNGCLIALEIDLDVLTDRLARSRSARPLLQDAEGNRLRGDALRARIEQLVEERRSSYESAHLVVSVGSEPADDVAERIVAAVRESGG